MKTHAWLRRVGVRQSAPSSFRVPNLWEEHQCPRLCGGVGSAITHHVALSNCIAAFSDHSSSRDEKGGKGAVDSVRFQIHSEEELKRSQKVEVWRN